MQWNLPKRPPLLIPIGSSSSQITIRETSCKRPPPVSDHLTKMPIGSSVSQITISETSRKRTTSRKRPPKPDIKGGRLQEVPLHNGTASLCEN